MISIYTCVRDGIFYDYHVVEMLKHHLPLADEIIVHEGYSSDATYERITCIDAKIKVFRSHWGRPRNGLEWIVGIKNAARERCTGKWCILLDCDEFIPEWEFARIREHLAGAAEDMVPTRMLNFYGNYRVYHSQPAKVVWPSRKMNIHRNLPDVEVWGDGSHVRLKGRPLDWSCSAEQFTCHHFGFVRDPARLRQKWSFFGNLYKKKVPWFAPPSFLFNWKPHDWMDPQFLDGLAIYDGPYVQAVRNDPEEFVRDGFRLHRWLLEKNSRDLLPLPLPAGESVGGRGDSDLHEPRTSPLTPTPLPGEERAER